MKHLLIIGTVFPEPASTAAGKRILQLVDWFLENHFKITFLSPAAISDNSFNLEELGVSVGNIAINDVSAENLLKEINPDVVMFDRFPTEEQFGWKVSEACPHAVKILDTEDLHFLRKAREQVFKQNKVLEKSDLISDVFKREIASILRCDLSLIISEFEMDLLVNTLKIDKEILHYLPMFAEPKPGSKTFAERKNFISIGNFLHEPNWQTVLKLKKLWPQIKAKLPDAEMHIYGAYVTEKARQLHNEKDKFLIKGRAESVEQIYSNAKVLLAPIPFGAGIKGKLLESMEFGLPNVTTEIGAEGMHNNGLWNGFIAKTDEEFVEKTVLLYNNETIWNESQQTGYKLVQSKFRKELFVDDLKLKIETLFSHLSEHRTNNFLGQILSHHSLQSTKYLGKWIEEKNKR